MQLHSGALLLPCLLLIGDIYSVRALTPDRRLTQYGHTAWRTPEAFSGSPLAIAQTKDGYIWIGTDQGLLRFDGVRFLSLPQFSNYPALRAWVGALRADRGGGLWVAAADRLYFLKDDEIREYATGAAGINKIIQDHAGQIWLTRYRVHDGGGPLCRVKGSGLTCYGEKDGVPGHYAVALAEDPQGYLWLGSYLVCRWRPGSSTIYLAKEYKSFEGSPAIRDIVSGPRQLLLASEREGRQQGIRVLSFEGPDKGQWKRYAVPGFDGTRVAATSLLTDSHEALWIGERTHGIDRIFQSRQDHFGSAEGLSSDAVIDFLEDREGDVWVLTGGGLDRFRDTAVVTYSVREGLGAANVDALLGARDGSVWVAGQGSLDVIRDSGIIPMRTWYTHTGGFEYYALLQDHAGRFWIGSNAGMFMRSGVGLHETRLAEKQGTIGEAAESMAEDSIGNIWVLTYGSSFDHLYRVRQPGNVSERVELPKDFEPRQVAASRKGGIWILSNRAELARSVGEQIERVPSGRARPASGDVSMYVDADDSVWIGTRKGLIWWDGHADRLIDTKNGLPCNSVRAIIRDQDQNLWLSTTCALISVTAGDIQDWQRKPDVVLPVRVLGALDGAHGGSPSEFPRVSLSSDGRLWFTDGRSIQRVDPRHLARNPTVPPVYIEELVADRRAYPIRGLTILPPRTRDVRITYAALSFPMPQSMRFRYKLEGHDTQWQDAGTRREAFYTDLSPGDYRLHVIACNNSGIWNKTGAWLPFRVQAAWYQTQWFLFFSVVLSLFGTWLLYRLRLRRVAAGISARFDERLAERTRLARELHDTLLQTIQGSKMVADNALDRTDDPDQMKQALERLAGWLGQAIQEGREALNSLRLSTTETNNLAEGLRRALEESAERSNIEPVFSVKGAYRDMHPILRDEIFRIGNEAILNAARHSHGTRIDVELEYGPDLRLVVRDDGVGMEEHLAIVGRISHFGLQGMRERASRIRGVLEVRSSPGSGTEVTLEVPGRFLYRKTERPGVRPHRNTI